MSDPKTNLLWLDIETTGMNFNFDQILEMAFVITDKDLNVLFEKEFIIHQNNSVLENMNTWCTEHHNASGLVEKVKKSFLSEKEVEKQIMQILPQFIDQGLSPLCGNTVHFDRAFTKKYLPQVNNYLHYRIIDVSSFKEIYKRWFPEEKEFAKKKTHRAMDDVKESIAELQFYREKFLK